MSSTDFNKLAKEIHQYNKEAGWWDGDREIETALMLVITEIAEATEGERKDLMDDHLKHRKMGEVELADALIRMLDIGGYLGLTYTKYADEWAYYYTTQSIFGKHFKLAQDVIGLYEDLTDYDTVVDEDSKINISFHYSLIIDHCQLIGRDMNYNILDAMYEKLEYNKTRADHKKENRMKVGGKKV